MRSIWPCILMVILISSCSAKSVGIPKKQNKAIEIVTVFKNMEPDEIEKSVNPVISEPLFLISGIDEIKEISTKDTSRIIVMLNQELDPAKILASIDQHLDTIVQYLPKNLINPPKAQYR